MFQTDKVEMTSEDVLIRLHHEQDLLGHALVTRVEDNFCDLGLISDDQRTVEDKMLQAASEAATEAEDEDEEAESSEGNNIQKVRNRRFLNTAKNVN